jgi:ligand-binding sensor domain-containing protein/serine phosphatase RsbU (regulator of sigma subunit)
LPDNFIYSITQGHNGFIWIGTSEALVRYDGRDFVNFTENDSLAEKFIQSLFVGQEGSLWIGHNEGQLSCHKNGRFQKMQSTVTFQPINDICEDKNGTIWLVDQKAGLCFIDQAQQVHKIEYNWRSEGRLTFYSLNAISPRKFLLGTSSGLYYLSLNESNEVDQLRQVEDIPATRINRIIPLKKEEGAYWIATDDEGFFHYSHQGQTAEHIISNELCLRFDIHQESILDIYEEDEGHLLLATLGNGVIKLIYDPGLQTFSETLNFSTVNGLKENNIKKILCDREGNYWFGSFTEGVFALTQDHFIFYNLDEIGFKDNAVYSVHNSEDGLWMGLKNGLLKTDPYCFANHEFYDKALGIPNDVIKGYYAQDNGTFWVATKNNGLYYRNPGQLRFQSYFYTNSILKQQITAIEGHGDIIYLGTMDSFFILDTKKKKVQSLSTNDGLLHNNINFVYKDRHKNIWIGTKNSGIAKIDSSLSIERHKIDNHRQINITGMTEDKDGHFWLASNTDGVYKYMYQTDSILQLTTSQGLKKNYCYSISCDYKNKIWVCHHPGLTSIDANSLEFKIYSHENSLESEFHQVISDDNETLWFASEHGIVNYFPERDQKNNIAPLLNFTSFTIDGESYDIHQPIDLPYPYGRPNYDIQLGFTGISFKNPEGVHYEFLLDDTNLDGDNDKWRSLGNTNFKEFDRISAGDYVFMIRAYNADGIKTIEPLKISFTIHLPFWQTWWFILICVLVGALAIYLFIVFRERKLKQQKMLLQKEVASQTVILRQQKSEIERKNRDITDSINYAKKIQSSILPAKSQLHNAIPDSFVFFQPRDIVSGDFYWFNQSGDYFVLCCADCTGHGVPGAFMSMIGTTVLNDIFRIPSINSPADMLERLDMEIKILLQANDASETRDGMDISIVEIHLPTKRVRLASAKRPVYMYINDELTIYKGNRRSIGDGQTETPFINVEYNCNKGDSIYLFSDGYTDQFGGPLGKKFMTVGVKNLINKVHTLPIEEQLKTIEDNFNDWKGDLDQIDDVLFMGLRL